MVVSENDILEQLKEFSVTATDEVLCKMKEFCFVYKCSAEDISDMWVAYASTKNIDLTPNLKILEAMEKEELMKNSNKAVKNKKSHSAVSTPVYNSTTIDLISGDGFGISDQPENQRHQPVVNRSPALFSPTSMSPACFNPSQKYTSRSGSGDTVCSFGNLQNVEWKQFGESSLSIKAYSDTTILREPYHFMSEKLRDRASILNDMIQDAAQCFQDKYSVQEWGHIQLPSVESIPVVGRICSDGNEKLNATSILLQGSQETSSGQTIPLDVSNLESFSFFPGQIIAGLGINSLGKKLILNKLHEGTFPPLPSKVPELSNCNDSLSIVIAAGPFTTSDSLSCDPLYDLMTYIKTYKPHVVILIGPLVDIKNEVIQKGNIPETYEEIFQNLIVQVISHMEGLSTKLILVPSTRDVHHNFIYPTPPYRLKQLTKRLYLASDPCMLNIEGVIIGVTSTDILFHLGKEEISYPQLPDRLGRLCSHILAQKNFYPLYPHNEEINIDYPHFEQYAQLPIMPHVLILPSDFRYFIKDVNGCCCINPERLTKRSTGGTFARMNIRNIPEENYNGSILDYLQADIIKI